MAKKNYHTPLNPKKGAVIGAGIGLLSVGAALVTSPELRELPLEEIVKAFAVTTICLTAAGSAIGYFNQKVMIPFQDYLVDKISNYKSRKE